jgi:hypothetical protein
LRTKGGAFVCSFVCWLVCAGVKAHVDFLARQAKYGGGVPQFGLLGDWCSVEPFCPGSSVRISRKQTLAFFHLTLFYATGSPKCIVSPRQAQEKHRESTQKREIAAVFARRTVASRTQAGRTVRKTPLFEQFIYTNDPFTKPGSGQI